MALFLKTAGHEVIEHREALHKGASDNQVALTAVENNAILIAFDSDFKSIASRWQTSSRKLRKLSRIHMRCKEPESVRRLKLGLSFIEHGWEVAKQNDGRIFIEVQGNGFKTTR